MTGSEQDRRKVIATYTRWAAAVEKAVKSRFSPVLLALLASHSLAADVVYYTALDDIEAAAFNSIAARAASDNDRFRRTIGSHMALESDADIEAFREYLAVASARIERDNLSDREQLICGASPRPAGEALLLAMDRLQDAILDNQRRHYTSSLEGLDTTARAKLEAWIHRVAEGTKSWKYDLDETDLARITRRANLFCSERGY